MSLYSELAHTLPELVLAGAAILAILWGSFAGETSSRAISWFAIAALALALVVDVTGEGRTIAWSGALIDDAFTRFMDALALTGALVALLMGMDFARRAHFAKFEYPVLVLLSTTGMLALISAQSLISLYLGLELMSLALYVLAAFDRDNVRASEAGLKYFVLGALSSGMLLYGASLTYGFSGSVQFDRIAAALQSSAQVGVVIGLAFLLTGLAFKMSLAPFHMWTPDVYEGAPTPVTAFFAAAPKMAAVAVTARMLVTAFPAIQPQWREIIVFISILSMAIGAFAAIGQTNIKRLLAYSSIGHMGFAMIGLAAGGKAGVSGVAIYMAIYLTMTLGGFAGVLRMRVGGVYVEKISDLSGLARSQPAMAAFFAALMFSMAGIPPLAGFFAKWYVFAAAIQAQLFGLAVVGVLASAISCFYYLRVVKVMYFDEPAAAFDRTGPAVNIVFALAGLAVLFYWVDPAPLVNAAQAAVQSLY